MGLIPEAVHQVVSKRASLVIHRRSTVPTIEVVLQLKLSAFTCRTEIAHRYRIYFLYIIVYNILYILFKYIHNTQECWF